MKMYPCVAVHCWKALSSGIVCCPLKIIFIKGPVFKLHIKFTAFNTHLPLKVLDFFKVLLSACSVLLKYCIFQVTSANGRKYMQKC